MGMGDKDFILSEIKRIAAANDGRSPGRQVFERETGIKGSAWLGLYWASWGEALAEAGLASNAFRGQTGIDEIFEGLAQAVRHYKRYPSEAQIRMYRRINPALPSHSTLTNRFPSKEQMLVDFLGWLASRQEHADVLVYLPTPKAEAPVALKPAQEGYVYLLKSGKHFKIGCTYNLERRIKEIRVALPEVITPVHVIRTDDPSGIEAYWHKRFDEKRANGEWFALSPQDVAAFKKRRFQ